MNVCYLIGAGEITSLPTPDNTDLVIAADGGYDALISHGVRCDLLVGDLDSIKDPASVTDVIRFPKEKDETDMYLAYREGVLRGYRDFEIYGGTGGREDHTYANYSLLIYIKEEGHTARLISDKMVISVIENESITLSGRVGATLSLFSLSKDSLGVTIEGAKYCLKGAILKSSFPLGVSNEFTGSDVTVSVENGTLLIMTEK